MELFRVSYVALVTSLLILAVGLLTTAQQNKARPFHQFSNRNKGPPVMCTHDSLLIYMDCRVCTCPRPNRIGKCYKKSCDLRTKDGGQCPFAVLKMDDGLACRVTQSPGCKIDDDCPGSKLCCFDFCGGSRCVDPVPLDFTTGLTVHNGRSYQ